MKDFDSLLSTEFIPLSEAKAKLSEQIRRVTRQGKRLAITSNGQPKAMLFSYEDYLKILRYLEEIKPESPERIIDFKEWKRGRAKRKKIRDSIDQLFDTAKLSRKGQKSYKRKTVREFNR